VDLCNRERPDLVALTGDYVNDFARNPHTRTPDMNNCARELGRLRARRGVFAVFGNHDFPSLPEDNPDRVPWLRAGITPLLDEAITLPIGGGARLVLVGLRSSLMRPVFPELFFPQVPGGTDVFRLLLWHEPDRAAESARAGAHAQLSGHTHGGQVVVPGVGPLVLPPQGKLYAAGRFDVEGMPLFVTRGIGMLPPRVRFCCPPEVALLTLRRR
jgi:predicted MPP superfamily phosphohydrolase